LRASLVSDTTKFDTLSVKTRVPGLVELGKGEHYILVGAPGDVDPCPHNVTSLHYRNHFGTATLIQAIDSIAVAYASLDTGKILRINDMSLEKGGMFDNLNDWTYHPGLSHGEHRIGKNADIGVKGIDQSTARVDLMIPRLKTIIKNKTKLEPYQHTGSNPHFHIRVK
jgi:hypothetical protein